MNRTPWAAWELQFLRDEYGGSLTRDIARALNRGLDSVRAHVRTLGLRSHITWTPELDEVLTLLYPDTVASAIGELIGCSRNAVHQRALVLGVKKDPAFVAERSRVTSLARSAFTPEIAATIERLYPETDTPQISRQVGISVQRIQAYAADHGWHKTKEFLSAAGRQRLTPDHPMRNTSFPKGHVPANKGQKGWYSGGRSSQTWFKKGVRGRNWLPIGSHRLNADGYLDRKVADTGYPPADWMPVHRVLWIQEKGPIPSGHVVRFREGCRTAKLEEITLDKLECITQAENMRRNSFRTNYPPELVKLVETRGHLNRMMNKRERALEEKTT